MTSRKPTTEVGAGAERAAVDYLRRAGMRVLERNYRCKLGEIDVVAQQGPTLVFIEVRSVGARASHRPAETIDHAKRRRIIRAAQWFVKQHRMLNVPCRFDVVEVYLDENQEPARVVHTPHAFMTN
jgi:putative endonuclease